MRVVVDASPAIFLAKVRRLDWVHALFGPDVRVAPAVREEALAPGVDAGEAAALEAFFAACSVERVRRRSFASSMSVADNETLSLAVECRAELLLCDDRVLRMMAEAEGIRPMGTLGVLLHALRAGLLSREEARRLLDALVRLHGFRIGIEVYQAVLARIARRDR